MAQFEHWTKETFSANFRKMLTLEQYRDPKLAQLHHDGGIPCPVFLPLKSGNFLSPLHTIQVEYLFKPVQKG